MAHALGALETSIGRIWKSAWSWIPTGLAHYLNVGKVLRGPISKRSRQGLDWLNFFLADSPPRAPRLLRVIGSYGYDAAHSRQLGNDNGQHGADPSLQPIDEFADLPVVGIIDRAPF
jgi:hypothetical protein